MPVRMIACFIQKCNTNVSEYPTFISHTQLKEYCQAYCEKFDLISCIKFGHEVVAMAEIKENGGWRVTTTSEDGNKTWLFDKVVITIGRHQTPMWPEIDGLENFKGSLIHSSR